jgi:hypothetical protein
MQIFTYNYPPPPWVAIRRGRYYGSIAEGG